MIENDFNNYLGLLPIITFIFILIMCALGKKNCMEEPLEKHIFLKVLGGFFIALGVLYVYFGCSFYSLVTFPDHSLSEFVSKNSHVRAPGTFLHIGYRTPAQGRVISSFYAAIQFFGLAAYLFTFRKSGTKGWQKALKVIAYTMIFLLLPIAFDFHYFDLFEFITPMILLLLVTACLINWRTLRKHDDVVMKDDGEKRIEEKTEVIEEDVLKEKGIIITDITDVEL